MIRLGLIGVGGTVSIADLHVEAIKLSPDFILTKVYNRTFDKATAFIKKHQLDATNCKSLEEFFIDLDAVIITTSNDTHQDMILMAAKHHLHMLVEKPLTGICESSQEIDEALKAYEPVIMLGYLNRYATIIEDAKNLIKDNFTKIFSIQGHFGGKRLANPEIPFEWRMSKDQSLHGASIDFGSHLLDLITYITEEKLSLISKTSKIGINKRLLNNEIKTVENDDLCAMTLDANDTLISILVSRIGLDAIDLTISGDGGLMNISYKHPMKLTYHHKNIQNAYTSETLTKTYDETQKDLMIKQLKVFKGAIKDKKTTYPNLRDSVYIDCLIDSN